MLKLLILNQSQFGQHVDTYMYCKYLIPKYKITYLCWDYGKSKQEMAGVEIVYVSREGNVIQRNLRYLHSAVTFLKHNHFDICFIKYFRGCFVLRLFFPKHCFIFDVRTGSVNKKYIYRLAYDILLRLESMFFRNVSIISQSLAKKLRLDNKAYILPLGSVHISSTIKSFEDIRLLYVGTLLNRQIEKTILGVKYFIKNHKDESIKNFSYTIIGDGPNGEVLQLRELVNKLGLHHCIKIVGRVPYEELTPYFDNHNIGISFVPLTSYFDVQPVTKTFDYLLSGMPVLGTATSENKEVIKKENGVLTKDTIDSFTEGLCRIIKKRNEYSSVSIVKKSQKYHRKIIVRNFEIYLRSIVGKNEHC